MSADELSVREVVAHGMWDSIDDRGIRGRLYREDCDYLAGVALDALTNPTVQAGMAEVLAGHQRWASRACICGDDVSQVGSTAEDRDRAFAAHQAAAIAAWLTGEGAS